MNSKNDVRAYSTNKQSSKQLWWRWLLLPIAALIGSLIGTVIMGVFQWLGMKLSGVYTEDGWYYKYVLPMVMVGTFGFLFSFISYRVAPSGKLIASSVMATIVGVLCITLVAWGSLIPGYTMTSRIEGWIQTVVLLVGAIAGVLFARDEDS